MAEPKREDLDELVDEIAKLREVFAAGGHPRTEEMPSVRSNTPTELKEYYDFLRSEIMELPQTLGDGSMPAETAAPAAETVGTTAEEAHESAPTVTAETTAATVETAEDIGLTAEKAGEDTAAGDAEELVVSAADTSADLSGLEPLVLLQEGIGANHVETSKLENGSSGTKENGSETRAETARRKVSKGVNIAERIFKEGKASDFECEIYGASYSAVELTHRNTWITILKRDVDEFFAVLDQIQEEECRLCGCADKRTIHAVLDLLSQMPEEQVLTACGNDEQLAKEVQGMNEAGLKREDAKWVTDLHSALLGASQSKTKRQFPAVNQTSNSTQGGQEREKIVIGQSRSRRTAKERRRGTKDKEDQKATRQKRRKETVTEAHTAEASLALAVHRAIDPSASVDIDHYQQMSSEERSSELCRLVAEAQDAVLEGGRNEREGWIDPKEPEKHKVIKDNFVTRAEHENKLKEERDKMPAASTNSWTWEKIAGASLGSAAVIFLAVLGTLWASSDRNNADIETANEAIKSLEDIEPLVTNLSER